MATTPQTARSLDRHAKTAVHWQRGSDVDFPWRAQVSGATWLLRLNDFPAEPLYTLLIDTEPIGDFDDWPSAWTTDATKP